MNYACKKSTDKFFFSAFDFDPNWTIPLAKKWCVHSEWVHLNTTPFYMFWRYTGTILGIAVVSSLNHLFHKYYQMPLSLVHKGLLTTSSVLIALLCSFAIPDSSSISVVYFCAFFVHAIVPIIIMGVLPWLLMNIFHPSSKDK